MDSVRAEQDIETNDNTEVSRLLMLHAFSSGTQHKPQSEQSRGILNQNVD